MNPIPLCGYGITDLRGKHKLRTLQQMTSLNHMGQWPTLLQLDKRVTSQIMTIWMV